MELSSDNRALAIELTSEAGTILVK